MKKEINEFMYIEEKDTIVSIKDVDSIYKQMASDDKYAIIKIQRKNSHVVANFKGIQSIKNADTALFFTAETHGVNYIEIRDDVFNKLKRELCGISIPRKTKKKIKEPIKKKVKPIPKADIDDDEVPF